MLGSGAERWYHGFKPMSASKSPWLEGGSGYGLRLAYGGILGAFLVLVRSTLWFRAPLKCSHFIPHLPPEDPQMLGGATTPWAGRLSPLPQIPAHTGHDSAAKLADAWTRWLPRLKVHPLPPPAPCSPTLFLFLCPELVLSPKNSPCLVL